MSRSLASKLTLAFLLVALTVALLVAVLIRVTSANQLGRLIVEQQRAELRTTLVDYYTANGSWLGVGEYVFVERRLPGALPTVLVPGERGGPGEYHGGFRRSRWEIFGLADSQGRVVIPLLPDYPSGATVTSRALAAGDPVELDGQVVGTILVGSAPPGLNPEEAAYLQRTNAALLLAGLGAVLVAVVVGGLLARTLTRPLEALTVAAHRMAAGELEQQVVVESGGEIGELAAAFNRMSREVSRANQARRQMTADVAHELRTPLTVIAGYIEAMRDGVLPPTPDRLAVIYAEIENLQHLVGDLRTLAQADTGELKLNREWVEPAELLRQAHAAFEHRAGQQGLQLDLQCAEPLPPIYVDEVRLSQVLSNLLSNALRYTPAGGRVELGAKLSNGERKGESKSGVSRRLSSVVFYVSDSGPGIAPQHVPHIFNRFYRADPARAETDGESGLGLAIAKALVEAHQGEIIVESTPGNGATFQVRLPAAASGDGAPPITEEASQRDGAQSQ